ncbi:hypothetical protein CIG75_06250 [Tumebacillus algifaecis]|uniref:Sporulation protein n=1 Tax=Tumebacillus algifaecis TaxID=1214604 RepID=A0A223CZ30_9BACL|nr:YhcN/YlaJ family sporulation lipoprotein [Tumebacillus algifaecis]ASS74608.1 hypothetical protein CIG75_06250 [Tumebacillus algifaecis]
MKKFTALAGALLLSSSLLAGCTPNAAPNNNIDKTRSSAYNTDRSGRIMDNTNGIGVRNTRYDNDRRGAIDNIGTTRRPNVLTNDALDRNRVGARDNTATRNMRTDRALEARVEAIPGVRNAKVLLSGHVAYVAINQGTALQGNRAGTMNRDVPPMAGRTATQRALTDNRTGGATQYGGTMSDRTYGTTGLSPTTPMTPQTRLTPGTYGTGTGTTGLGVGNGAYGTSGAGTYGTYGTGRGMSAGTYGTYNAGTNQVGTYNAGTNTADVSNDIKQRVISAVKQGNPSITTVHVSANPALYSHMESFIRDTASGHPMRGLGDLGDMLRRLFPTSGTAGTTGTTGVGNGFSGTTR